MSLNFQGLIPSWPKHTNPVTMYKWLKTVKNNLLLKCTVLLLCTLHILASFNITSVTYLYHIWFLTNYFHFQFLKKILQCFTITCVAVVFAMCMFFFFCIVLNHSEHQNTVIWINKKKGMYICWTGFHSMWHKESSTTGLNEGICLLLTFQMTAWEMFTECPKCSCESKLQLKIVLQTRLLRPKWHWLPLIPKCAFAMNSSST